MQGGGSFFLKESSYKLYFGGHYYVSSCKNSILTSSSKTSKLINVRLCLSNLVAMGVVFRNPILNIFFFFLGSPEEVIQKAEQRRIDAFEL